MRRVRAGQILPLCWVATRCKLDTVRGTTYIGEEITYHGLCIMPPGKHSAFPLPFFSLTPTNIGLW